MPKLEFFHLLILLTVAAQSWKLQLVIQTLSKSTFGQHGTWMGDHAGAPCAVGMGLHTVAA